MIATTHTPINLEDMDVLAALSTQSFPWLSTLQLNCSVMYLHASLHQAGKLFVMFGNVLTDRQVDIHL